MGVFPPDLFSDPVPRFWAVEQDVGTRILSMLETRYPRLGPFGPVLRCGEIGINSKNFRVEGGGQPLIVKETSASVGETGAAVRFAEHVRRRGAPLPQIFSGASGDLFTDWGGALWYVMESVEGSYFSGGHPQLQSAAVLLSKLWSLRDINPEERPLRALPLLGSQDVATAESFGRRLDEASALLGNREADLLLPRWREIRASVETTTGQLMRDPPWIGVMHIDLHPHNIIIRTHGEAVALDADSFQTCAPAVALAFGAFKLLRQAATRCDTLPDAGTLLARLGGYESARLETLARSEILRRICIILRLGLAGDQRWAPLLPVHLRALDEARLLFLRQAGARGIS
jgi:Ser/Thr protein kinase RdoA (MazF antagonist)